MKARTPAEAIKLEDLPNIGPSIADDLRELGIHTLAELAQRDPLRTYLALGDPMGPRHDPCVLYTLLAAQHFLTCGEALRWWAFTEAGKDLLGSRQVIGQAPPVRVA
ncbi:helix-hairpin-helix domain-containing protein [Viridibacterium curvum]|uniref:Helix-hairpin-helix domain-containing protein n=1 Tax=Viridibacterium curvum TaxID=1101404 RepID=A0ABP9QEW5_9RHOO